MMKKRVLVGLVLFMALSVTYAQQIKMTSIELDEGDVYINYSLSDENPDRKYTLRLYSSLDNYISPLEQVEGDIGVDIPQGPNRRIVWHAKEELGDFFSDKVALELKGSVYVPFISLNEFEENKIVKRTQSFSVNWAGGRGDNVLLFELYKGDKKVYVFEEEPNVGNASLIIPRKVKPGKDYRLKISDQNNQDEIVYSEPFEVKRKIPQYLQIGGAFILGGVATYLIINAIPPPDIPGPPDPANN